MLDTKLGALQKALASENENRDLERQRDRPKHTQMAEPTPTTLTDLQPAGKLNRLPWPMGDNPGEKIPHQQKEHWCNCSSFSGVNYNICCLSLYKRPLPDWGNFLRTSGCEGGR